MAEPKQEKIEIVPKTEERLAQKILAHYGDGISKARYVANEIKKILEESEKS